MRVASQAGTAPKRTPVSRAKRKAKPRTGREGAVLMGRKWAL